MVACYVIKLQQGILNEWNENYFFFFQIKMTQI